MTTLAIIGAGPKAAAIAARACVLNELYDTRIALDVFDRLRGGANWDGSQGYTASDQLLCTPVQRDLGYPYTHDERRLADRFWELFSWAAYLGLSAPLPPSPVSQLEDFYAEHQVEAFQKHTDLASYVRWALKRACALDSGIKVHNRKEVVGLEHSDGQWTVTVRHCFTDGTHSHFIVRRQKYDGVVVTGPGPAARRIEIVGDCLPRVLDGVSYWQMRDNIFHDVRTRPEWTGPVGSRGESSPPILIGGAGGTAAAIAADIVTNLEAVPVILVSRQATIFSRGSSAFENALFTSPEEWRKIELSWRQDFIGRTIRGIVWPRVMDIIGESRSLNFQPGRVGQIEAWKYEEYDFDSLTGETIKRERNFPRFVLQDGREKVFDGAWAIDATGFDAWWFSKLFCQSTVSSVLIHKNKSVERQLREILRHNIPEDMTLPPPFPARGLHVPMLSDLMCGPHCSNLMALGLTAQAILLSHQFVS